MEAMSLYKLAIDRVANDNFPHYLLKCDTNTRQGLTTEMQFDICLALSKRHQRSKLALCRLKTWLSQLQTFLDFLQLGHKRVELHQMFELINTHCRLKNTLSLNKTLAETFMDNLKTFSTSSAIHHGLNLASFLMDSGWYVEAMDILQALKSHGLIEQQKDQFRNINCKLLHALSEYRRFDVAETLVETISKSDDITSQELCEVSNFYYWRSLYNQAHDWGIRALRSIGPKSPSRIVIDVLRHAGKTSVVRRQFPLAQLLLGEALSRSQEIFGKHHLKYADCLVDYAFYLLNVDEVAKSVQAYEEALYVRESILGHTNLLVAKVYEELAYATYVVEYSLGHFDKAKHHAEAALLILHRILPPDHLLVASSQRVLALILEEIAIDLNDKKVSNEMLARAEQLHLSAVALSTRAFGEMNVQTAKHYGNLGRLYQTMERYDEAERMHLKAIHIKETLLGEHDYEVALSIGHLASLYNYDLAQYVKAEELYLRSIDIVLRLFGKSYSGLEYDYRGLIRVYEETGDISNVYKYLSLLHEWEELKQRRDNNQTWDHEASHQRHSRPIQQIIQMADLNNADKKILPT